MDHLDETVPMCEDDTTESDGSYGQGHTAHHRDRECRPDCRNGGYSMAILISNVLAFIANVLLVNCAHRLYPSIPTVREVLQRYNVMLAPSAFTLDVMWPITYGLALAFVIYQAIPIMGQTAYVQYGVSVWWIATSLFQILWLYSWVYEAVGVAFIAIAFQWLSLTFLNWSISVVDKTIAESPTLRVRAPWATYWCVKVPFAVYWSFSTVLLVLNANSFVVTFTHGQLALHMMATVLSIVVYTVWTFFSAFCIPYTGVWQCAVVGWILLGTLLELNEPRIPLSTDYPPFVLYGIWLSLLVVDAFAICLTGIIAVNNIIAKYHTRSGFSTLWNVLSRLHYHPRHRVSQSPNGAELITREA